MSTPVSRFCSENAYAVYVIHGWVVVPITWSFIALDERASGVVVTWTDANNSVVYLYTSTSPDCLSASGDQGSLLLAGFVYMLVLSFVAVYVLASLIRRIPGVRDIL